MHPWPAISRGTECSVPMVPGLVIVAVVASKLITASLPARARRTTSSYVVQNWRKSISSAALMFGTSSCRVPSAPCTSMASPRLTWSGLAMGGLRDHRGLRGWRCLRVRWALRCGRRRGPGRGRLGRRGPPGARKPEDRLRPGSAGEGGLIVGEEAPPGPVHRTRVGQIPLVELLDQPLVGAEVGLVRGVIRRGPTYSRALSRAPFRLARRAGWLL